MKKTISIHIKGINFLIEEDAYEILKDYLKRLETMLSSVTGKEEILEDIELRIVELFSTGLSSRKEVIEENDVRETIERLGEPEQFIDEEAHGAQQEEQKTAYNQENASYTSSEKKLYRNIENASIAGVCSGLAAYMNIDVIIVRVLFILFTLAAGFGVPLYIILWVVLPTAHTHIDRLRMRGRPITVENVREEVEKAAERMTNSSHKFASKIHRDSVLQRSFRTIGQIISKTFGGFLLFLGIVFSIAFFVVVVGQMGTTPVKTDEGFLGLHEFGLLFFEDPEILNFMWISGSILALIGIIWFIASGTRLLFNLRFPWYKYLSRTALFAGIIGIVLAFYFGSIMMREFSMEKTLEREIMVSQDSLEIKTENYKTYHGRRGYRNYRRNRDHYWLKIKENRIEERGVNIRYEVSPDSLYHIVEEKSSMSRNDRQALRRAKNIEYNLVKNGNTITLPNRFTFPQSDKIRNQRVRIYVQIPAGKSLKVNEKYIYQNNQSEDWGNDIDDVQVIVL